MNEEQLAALKEWRNDLENQMNSLRAEYDDLDRDIKVIRFKIDIARRAASRNNFREEGFCSEYLGELQEELENAKEGLQEAEDEFNEKYSFLKAISDEIDSEIGTLN